MKKVLFIFMLFASTAAIWGQSYRLSNTFRVVVNGDTLRNPWSGALNSAQFSAIDLDKDGKLDLVYYDRADRTFTPYLNISQPGEEKYAFAPAFKAVFDTCKCAGWALMRDYDHDGYEDVVCGSLTSNISIFKHHPDANGLHFEQVYNSNLLTQYNPQFLPSALYSAITDIPAFEDVDNDGDTDFLTFGNSSNYVEWHKNYAMEEYGRVDTLVMKLKSSCWGHFYENSSNNSAVLHDTVLCAFGNKPFYTDTIIETRHAGSTLSLLDLDGNGKKDLLIGDISFSDIYAVYDRTTLFQGLPEAYIDSIQTNFPSYDKPIDLDFFPGTFYLDYNNDGLKDLLVSPNLRDGAENKQSVWHYYNSGTNDSPIFNFNGRDFLQNTMLDFGTNAHPVFTDYNNDGKTDIVVGNFGYYEETDSEFYAGIALLTNVGTFMTPIYTLSTADMMGLIANKPYPNLKNITPTLGDLDGDGDKDMLVGNALGTIYYFVNNGITGGLPQFSFVSDNYQGINVGASSAPCLYDIDKDMDLDIIIGNNKGDFAYYKNTGSTSNPIFTLVTTKWGNVKVNDLNGGNLSQGFSKPLIIDYDKDGQVELLSGTVYGKVQIFKNLSVIPNDTFDYVGHLFDYDFGSYSAPAAAIIDVSNKPTFVVGNSRGGLQSFVFEGTTDIQTPLQNTLNFSIAPNPSSGMLTIKTPSSQPHLLQIFNHLGQKVWEEDNLQQSESVHTLTHLPQGIYAIRITMGSKTGVQQWIKQ